MKTYLVEDDALKAKRLTGFITEKYPFLHIQKFASFQSGLRALEESLPDLLILDMTLPTFDRQPNQREGRIRPLGGYELMRKLKLRNLFPHVIVVTQLETFGDGKDKVSFADISTQCKRDFGPMFIGSVYFRQDEATWQAELERLIDVLVEPKND
ncbi:response regulator [Noviherbaspirillum soli]|uniref:response regulator n=1 Tax=Noviherbaspirillum soli TaxID=1064518 RepID=UPI00188D8C01|nr:response regulator [Noviherbaspirillum soli]